MDFRIGAETLPMPAGEAGERLPARAAVPRAWRFDGFEFDLRRGELYGPDGTAIALRPKAEALLRHFLAGPGRLFSRDELISAIWPAAVVTDDSLVQCVVELRTALGDRAQRLIRTVPRRGYRLEAAVTTVYEALAGVASTPLEGPAAPVVTSGERPFVESASAGTRPRRSAWLATRLLPAATIAVSGVLIGAAAWHSSPTLEPVNIDAEIAARGTVAIMRFAVPPEPAALRTMADTVADEIASQFSTRIGMRGIGRNATAAFDGPNQLDGLRVKLKARHVVTGRLAPLGGDGRIAIDAQLANADDGMVYWSRRFEGTPAHIDSLAADVGQQLANAVRNRGSRSDLRRDAAEKLGAAELTLLGWRELDLRKSLDDVRQARSHFETALRQDPKSVIATNGLAATYSRERSDPASRMTADQIDAYEQLVERARALAPDDATALLLWGDMQITRGRADLALPALEKANRLVPSYPAGYMLLSRSLMMLGRTDEVRPKLERAIELGVGDGRKTSGAYSLAAEAALMLGDDERAREMARRGIAALPSNADAHATLAAVDALAGRTDQAAAQLAAFRKLVPTATVARLDELRRSENPLYLDQRARLYEGLRKAGLPER